MLHSRLTISVVALLAALIASPVMAQNLPRGAYATVPVPGQPAAPVAPTPAPAAPQPPGAPRPPTPGAQTQKPEEQQRVVADPATNSLIIYGTAQEFQNIKNILKDLDIVPRQVLLDVLIAEVTLSDDQSFGIEYEIFRRSGVSIFGQTFNSHGAIRSGILPALPDGATITPFANGISGVIGRSNAVRAFINAATTDSRFKILSSPSVLAADNRPARIQIGSEEPIATGTIAAAVGGVAQSTSIQYRNTGRIVTIIPQVNSQGLVNLQLLAEVSSIREFQEVGQTGTTSPAFDIRQAETTAVVQDGDTLVVGGMISNNSSRTRTGIPYLMDIPVIGRFFGSTTDLTDRTELIMLITPHVIRNRDESRQVTEDFKKSLSTVRNELERMAREREKLQQRPLEEKPALPGPSGDPAPAPNLPATSPPPPAPSSAPAGPGASVMPLRKINLPPKASPNAAVKDLPSAAGGEMVSPAPGRRPLSVQVETPQPEVPPLNPQHAYALSVTRHPEKTPAATIQHPASEKLESKPLQQWTVQVASMDRQKDAEELAGVLRSKGYDAYVIAANIDGKTWHRIRVGQSLSRADASKLQKILQVSEKFESSYMLTR
jgi:cell division septation protein DedD